MDRLKGPEISLAILLTCHNRKDITLACLRAVEHQVFDVNLKLDIYLVDDGSTDGTSEAVLEKFSTVRVIQGDGTLYWNGGMSLAFQTAIDRGEGYDFYLWLNDDTVLYKDALKRLLESAKSKNGIIVGSSLCTELKCHTYGGVRQGGYIHSLRFGDVKPDAKHLIKCDTFNGNCVLIPRFAVSKVGNLSPEFTHGIGDFDYGLRAKKVGIKSWVAPGYYGECSRNSLPVYFDKNKPLLNRLIALHSPNGLPPREWAIFARKYAPLLWPLYMLKLFIRVVFP